MGKKSKEVLDPMWREKRPDSHYAFLRPEERLLYLLTQLAELMAAIGTRLEDHLEDTSKSFKIERSELISLHVKAQRLGHLTDAMLNGKVSYTPKGGQLDN
jgi:hypothetical protein